MFLLKYLKSQFKLYNINHSFLSIDPKLGYATSRICDFLIMVSPLAARPAIAIAMAIEKSLLQSTIVPRKGFPPSIIKLSSVSSMLAPILDS